MPKNTTFYNAKDNFKISGFQLFTNLEQIYCKRGVGVFVAKYILVNTICPLFLNVPKIKSEWLDTVLPDKNFCIGIKIWTDFPKFAYLQLLGIYIVEWWQII